MERLRLDRQNLKKFGITLGVAFALISLLIFIRQKHSPAPTLIASVIFFILALAIPGILRPVYIVWMKLAFILGWINTRIVLLIFFYLVFTPIGLLLRIFGRDLLDKRVEKDKASYWKRKEKRESSRLCYERQF